MKLNRLAVGKEETEELTGEQICVWHYRASASPPIQNIPLDASLATLVPRVRDFISKTIQRKGSQLSARRLLRIVRNETYTACHFLASIVVARREAFLAVFHRLNNICVA